MKTFPEKFTVDAAPGSSTPTSGALNTSKFMDKGLWVGGTINTTPPSRHGVVWRALEKNGLWITGPTKESVEEEIKRLNIVSHIPEIIPFYAD